MNKCTEANGYCDFCGSDRLWPNYEDITDNKIAILPSCLWHICLTLVPLGWLMAALPFFCWDLSQKTRYILPKSRKYWIKAISYAAFTIAPVAQIIILAADENPILGGQILSNSSFVITGLLVVVMNELLRRCGAITSGTITIYWAITAAIFWFYFTTVYSETTLFSSNNNQSAAKMTTFIVFIVQSCLATLNLIFSCFPETLPETYHDGSYEINISWINSMVYAWLTNLITLGYRKSKSGEKKGLSEMDVQNLKASDRTVNKYENFEKNWYAEVERVNAINMNRNQKITKSKPNQVTDINNPVTKHNLVKPSLYRVMFATFYHELLITVGWKVVNDVLNFASPQILKALINFIDSPVLDNGEYEKPEWLGYLYAASMFVVTAVLTLIVQRYWYHTYRVGLQARCVISALIYKKSLKINFSNQGTTVGQVVNYMSVDAQKFQDTMNYINMIWSAPLQITLSLIFLYLEIGWSAFMALAIFAVVAPLSRYCTKKMREAISKMMRKKDRRIKIMNELLSSMKVLKLYAWEEPYMAKVEAIRNAEIKLIKQNCLYQSVVTFLWELTPYLVQLVCFATFLTTGNLLNAELVYTSISLFNLLRYPVNIFPTVSIMIINLQVAHDRIVNFLFSDEIDFSSVKQGLYENNLALLLDTGDYYWKSGGKRALTNVKLRVSKGSNVAIVGPVGCGKSAVISALLGELYTENGSIEINGTVAYIPQQAWIQNLTLKDNILFGNPFDEKKYQEVINACCLRPDLKILDQGDQTEIGERGINLSGGQKQRVSIARAVYADKDTYILDDPLSAVDAHVGRKIFDNILGPYGLLKNKTKLIVTHSTQYLPDVDDIVVMDTGGVIIARGSLTDLKAWKNERIEAIISVQNKDKSTEKQEEVIDDKYTAVTGNENRGKIIVKEATEAGALSMSAFISYFKACGFRWCFIYLLGALTYQVGDISYNIWLSTWVDSISWYKYTDKGVNQECLPPNQINPSVDALVPCDCGYGKNNTFSNNCYGDSFYLSVYGGIGLTVGLLSFAKSITMLQGIVRSAKLFHSNVLCGVMKSPMTFFDTTPIGRVLNRFSKDLDSIDMAIPISIRQSVTSVLQIVGILYILGRTNAWFILMIVPVGIIFIVIERYFITTNRQLKRLESATRSPIYSSFSETISGASVVRAYKVQNRFIKDNLERVDFNLKFQYVSLLCNRWLGCRLEFVSNFITFFVAVFATYSRGDPDISAADMGLALTYALSVTMALNHLIRVMAELEVNLVAVERLSEYAELYPEPQWRKNSTTKSNKNWMKKGRVVFDKYNLRYRPGLPLVLHNIECIINNGEKIGIVGRTGAGKSSLTVGMFRLVEAASGRILMDQTDTNELGLHDLREELTIIPQEPVLFSGPLRENLDPFGGFTDDELWTALKQAHLYDSVIKFEAKLEHEISENGSNLSVGEKQLICLARALLRSAKVLVLDEATSAVDNNTDSLIQKTIRKEFAKLTIITIAHRLNTVLDYDRIMVLDMGRIVEFASPIDLYAQEDSVFRSMCIEANVREDDIVKSKSNMSEIVESNDKPLKMIDLTEETEAKLNHTVKGTYL